MEKTKKFSLTKFYICLLVISAVIFVVTSILSAVFERPKNSFYHDHDGDIHYVEVFTKEKIDENNAYAIFYKSPLAITVLTYEGKEENYHIFTFENNADVDVIEVSISNEEGKLLELVEYPKSKELVRDAAQTAMSVISLVGLISCIVSVVLLVCEIKKNKENKLEKQAEKPEKNNGKLPENTEQKCKKCGAENNLIDIYCSNCGEKLK